MDSKPKTTTITNNKDVSNALVDENGKPMIHIKVFSPYKTYLNYDGYSISGVNNTGPFDVLPKHHNFITLLNPCVLEIKLNSGVKHIHISKGIMHVKSDQVLVFLDV